VAVPNLTRDDAAARARLLAVDSYDLHVDLTDGTDAPASAPSVDDDGAVHLPRARRRTFIDLVAETVRSATLNGPSSTCPATPRRAACPLPGLAAENTLVVDADCRYSNSGEGLHRFVDPEDGQVYLYTHFEPAEAKRCSPASTSPTSRHLHRARDAPFDWQVVSNTGGRTVEAGPGGSQLVHFAPTERLSTYLLALIAGPTPG
jgi:aminopeptidase N